MGFSLSSLDVHYLVKEIRPLIQESFVDKVYQGKEEKGDFLLRLRSPKTGKQQVFVQVPDALFLTEHRYQWPKEPAGFCMQLRKHLTNTQLVSIEQHGFERIIELRFRKGDVTWTLVIELFSKGNVILVNQEGLIRGVMDLQRWKDRTLRVNAPYEYPPGARTAATLSLDELTALLEENDRAIVKFCATGLGLGGKYAEELVARTGIDKQKTTLSNEEMKLLHEALHELFDEDIQPVLYRDDAAPFPLHAWGETTPAHSFSEAIESLVVAEKIDDIEEDTEKTSKKLTGKWQRIIDEQTQKVSGYKKSSEESQRKGELIYEHYQELKELFLELKRLHASNGWVAVKSFINDKELPLIVDETKGTITFDIN